MADPPRSATDRWLARHAARDARRVTLEEALLAGRTGRYAWYRLRRFGASYLVDCTAQALLAVVAVAALPSADLLIVVTAGAVATVATHLWWGALEALRSRVRDLHRAARPHHVAPAIAGWLTAGALLGALVVAGLAVALAVARVVSGGPPGPAGAYVAALVLGLAVELPLRAYHSGIYATRRIHRPIPATFAAPVIGTAALLAATPVLGPYALATSALVTTAVSAGLTVVYTRRMYRFLGLDPWLHVGRPSLARAVRDRPREAAAAGLANAVIGVDALLAVGLLGGTGHGAPALLALFLTLPTLTACAEWARLLYFDLKKLEVVLFTNLRHRFDTGTAVLAWLLGLGFGTVAAVLALVVGGVGATVALTTAAFVVARTILAHAQVRAFAARSYVGVVGVGAVAAAAFLAVRTGLPGAGPRLVGAALAAGACAVVLHRLGPRVGQGSLPGAVFPLEWLRRLGAVREPVRVGTAVLAPAPGTGRMTPQAREEAGRWRLAALAGRVAGRLGRTGAVTWMGPDRVVWHEPPDAPRVTAAWLQRTSGGLVRDVHVADHPDGEEALLRTALAGRLGRASTHLRSALGPVDVAAAVRRFRATVPGGIVLDPTAPPSTAVADLPGSELAAILADAAAFARDLQVRRRRSRFDVTPLCSGGALVLIFLAGRDTPPRARRNWHVHVRALDVQAAVAGLHTVPARPVPAPPPSADRRVGVLRRSVLLGSLPRPVLARLAGVTGERRAPAGATVVVENEVGVGFFVIAEGRADVLVGGAVVATLGPGAHFGDFALVAGSRRTATVVAATDLRCLTLTSWDFRRLVESDPRISWAVLSAMAAQVLPRLDLGGAGDAAPARAARTR